MDPVYFLTTSSRSKGVVILAKFLGNFVTQKGPLPVVNSVAIYAHFQTKKPVVSKSGESM